MDEKKFDWLDCSLFLMIANSESTDHYLTEEEITAILDRAAVLAKTFAAESGVFFTQDDVSQKFNMVFDYYNNIGEEAPDGKMDTYIMNEVYKTANYLKQQVSYSEKFAKQLIADLVIIANADDEFVKKEKKIIKAIAKILEVENPLN
jgi:hypothetical protein